MNEEKQQTDILKTCKQNWETLAILIGLTGGYITGGIPGALATGIGTIGAYKLKEKQQKTEEKQCQQQQNTKEA